MTQELQFGQRVKVCGQARRHKYYYKDIEYRVEWISGIPQTRQETVLLIGKRTVFNGIIHWDNEYDGYHFEQTKPVNVYLVVRNMRENPFYVFPDQIMTAEIEAVP